MRHRQCQLVVRGNYFVVNVVLKFHNNIGRKGVYEKTRVEQEIMGWKGKEKYCCCLTFVLEVNVLIAVRMT